jgi:iron complex outermembrane receptor protein
VQAVFVVQPEISVSSYKYNIRPDIYWRPYKTVSLLSNRASGNPLYEQYFPDCAGKEWVTVGAGYTYTGFKNLALTLNVQNLFDTPAPYDPRFGTNSSTGAPLAGYNAGLHNQYGRYFTVSAKYAF